MKFEPQFEVPSHMAIDPYSRALIIKPTAVKKTSVERVEYLERRIVELSQRLETVERLLEKYHGHI